MYAEMKNYRAAIDNYEKALAIDSNYFLDYNLPYSIDLAGTGNFDKALQAIDRFLTISNLNETSRKAGEYRQRCYRFAIEYAATHPYAGYKFGPENLGDSINTDDSEYYPSISLDGDTLFFTRRIHHTNEDLFESHRLSGGAVGARPTDCPAISIPTRTKARKPYPSTVNGWSWISAIPRRGSAAAIFISPTAHRTDAAHLKIWGTESIRNSVRRAPHSPLIKRTSIFPATGRAGMEAATSMSVITC